MFYYRPARRNSRRPHEYDSMDQGRLAVSAPICHRHCRCCECLRVKSNVLKRRQRREMTFWNLKFSRMSESLRVMVYNSNFLEAARKKKDHKTFRRLTSSSAFASSPPQGEKISRKFVNICLNSSSIFSHHETRNVEIHRFYLSPPTQMLHLLSM